MTHRSATHATFIIERTYNASPARVFAAWSDPEAVSQWFTGGDGWKQTERKFDFRVGGRDRLCGVWDGSSSTEYDSRYEEIVPNERIIYTYNMHLDGKFISISLATVQFKPAGAGTQLSFTEQLVCLDGYSDPDGRDRQAGVRKHLDRLETYLERIPSEAVRR